ncbi:MAG: GerMN domain-containing protein [Acidimicrobiales bacterium]|nr:GerMN domain-containing protein [Acidimicrobiales bacterium]
MTHRLLVALVVALIAGACSVPTDGEVREIAIEDLPEALQGTEAGAPTTEAPAGQTVTLYFVQTDSPRLRTVERASGDGRLLATLRALLSSPATDEEISQNLVNLLVTDPQNEEVEPVVVLGVDFSQLTGIAVINLSNSFVDLLGPRLVEAHAQLVYTATAGPRVTRVRLLVDGEPADLSTENGLLPEATRRDYPSFDPNSFPVLDLPTSTTEAAAE